MRYALMLALVALTCGCSNPFASGRFALFETSKGVLYRLDTTSGHAEIVYSPFGMPKLTQQTLYESDDGKTYEYLGAGKLRELSATEIADRLVEKYAK